MVQFASSCTRRMSYTRVFLQVEPDELWEEFFEFVEDVPSYDEIINYDVWQEFRDVKYPC